MSRKTVRHRALVVRADGVKPRRETLAGEEPLEIRVNGERLAVTMRTPGDDFDLVAGNLVSEGLLAHTERLATMRYCAGAVVDDTNTYNVIDAAVLGLGPDALSPRRVITTSACGVCGSASIDDVRRQALFEPAPVAPLLDIPTLLALPDRLREAQALFDTTGGLHAAGLFTAAGDLECAREDVGRHNAVDKVVGWGLREGRLPLRDRILQVSGRASFELVQKCYLAGIPVLAAVSAPSSLAVELAEEVGLTLVGFSRGERATVYTHPERIIGAE